MKPVVSVKELMRFDIDPVSDNIFDAVTYNATTKGSSIRFRKPTRTGRR